MAQAKERDAEEMHDAMKQREQRRAAASLAQSPSRWSAEPPLQPPAESRGNLSSYVAQLARDHAPPAQGQQQQQQQQQQPPQAPPQQARAQGQWVVAGPVGGSRASGW